MIALRYHHSEVSMHAYSSPMQFLNFTVKSSRC